MQRFTGKVVQVTGATSGIGRATALAFAREGARLIAAGRRMEEGQALVREIEQAGGAAQFVKTDVTDESQVMHLMEKTLSTFGRLDVAFNNAGFEGLHFVPVQQQTVENFHAVMNCNVLGTMLCLKHQVAVMLKEGQGAIINNASVAGVVGISGMSVYVASKHAVLGLTKSVALEVAGQGIRVNAVSPGVIETEMYDRFAADGSPREALEAMHAVGRFGKVEEIASAVLYLASSESSFVTGTNLVVDGGLSVP